MKSRIKLNKRLHCTPLVSLIVLLLVRSTLSYMQIKSLFASNVNAHSASNYRTLSPLRPDTTGPTRRRRLKQFPLPLPSVVVAKKATEFDFDFSTFITTLSTNNSLPSLHDQDHTRRPRGSQSGREKRRDERFSSTGERAPGYRLSSNYFQKFKRMPAPDWAQKMLCSCAQLANSFS